MSWSRHISRSITTPNRSSRGGLPVVEFIIHHNASLGGSYVLSLMQSGSKQVSANYQIMQDGEAVGVVPREDRSWSVSNSTWDGSAITFEIANNSGAPGWTISDAAYVKVAKIIADDAAHFGIPINRTTVRGHREGSALGHGGSYATACPGGIDLDRLVRMAQQFASSGTAGDGYTLIKEIPMPALIHHPNGSIGFVSDAGELDAISSMTEVDSLRAVGLVGEWVDLPDGLIWNTLVTRTARLRTGPTTVDTAAVAASLAATIIPVLLEAVLDEGVEITEAQVEAAAARAIKSVLKDAAA